MKNQTKTPAQSVPPAPEPPTQELKPEPVAKGPAGGGYTTPALTPAEQAKKTTSITVWCTEEEKARWTAHVGTGKLSEKVRELLAKECLKPRTTPWAWEQNGIIKPE